MGCLMPWSAWWVQGKVVVSTLSSSEEKKQNCQEVKKKIHFYLQTLEHSNGISLLAKFNLANFNLSRHNKGFNKPLIGIFLGTEVA